MSSRSSLMFLSVNGTGRSYGTARDVPAHFARSDRATRPRPHGRGRDVRLASAPVQGGERTGGCLCGAVRYSVRGDPVHVGRCHCTDCRKETGSAFTVYAQGTVEAFDMSGEMSIYDGRGFCPRCGSRLLNPAEPPDTLVEIRI